MTRILLILNLMLLGAFASGQDADAANQEKKPDAIQESKEAAIEFLEKVEEKNKDLKTLHGTFSQVRMNTMFMEEIHSNGEFWYSKPSRFRCDYFNPSPAQFFLIGNTGYFYSPENKHVDKYTMKSGSEAPINEMLVGFGLDVEKILDVFTVRLSPEQPEDEDLIRIDFISNDKNRTLDFQKIVITFDRKTLEPKVLFMQESEDTVEITLKKIEKNPKIIEGTYETNFGDATVFVANE